MGWWPFSRSADKPEGAAKLNLDPELQKYMEDTVSSQRSKNTRAAAPEPGNQTFTLQNPNDTRKLKTVKQIALDNCVEYERAFTKCVAHGSIFQKYLSNCFTQQSMYYKCQDMQTHALNMLKYAQAADDAERQAIKMRADDLMIKAAPSLIISTEDEDVFDKLLEAETSK